MKVMNTSVVVIMSIIVTLLVLLGQIRAPPYITIKFNNIHVSSKLKTLFLYGWNLIVPINNKHRTTAVVMMVDVKPIRPCKEIKNPD